MEIRSELWSAMRGEIRPLWEALGDEAEQSAQTPPPCVDMGIYDAADAADTLISIAARVENRLVGFWLAFLFSHPHHEGKLVAAADLVYLAPEHRGGWGMMRAFRLLRDEAKRRGAVALYANSPIGRDLGSIFRRCDLAPVETQYSVWF